MAMSRLRGARSVTSLPPIEMRPLRDLFEPRDHAEKGALAAARGPHQHHELAVLDAQADVVHRRDAAGIDLGQVLELDLGHARGDKDRTGWPEKQDHIV
jgi:hypothetical protein